MGISLLTITGNKDESLKAKPSVTARKTPSSHKFSSVIDENNASNDKNTISSSGSVENKKETKPEVNKKSSHKEDEPGHDHDVPHDNTETDDNAQIIKTSSDVSEAEYGLGDSDDDLKEGKESAPSVAPQPSGQPQNICFNITTPFVPNDASNPLASPSSDSSSKTEQKQIIIANATGNNVDNSVNREEISTTDSEVLNSSSLLFGVNGTEKKDDINFPLMDGNVSVSNISVTNNVALNIPLENSTLFNLQERNQSEDENSVIAVSPEMATQILSDNKRQGRDFDAASQSGAEEKENHRQSRDTKSPVSVLKQNNPGIEVMGDKPVTRSDKDVLFSEVQGVNSKSSQSGGGSTQGASQRSNEKDVKTVTGDIAQITNILSDGAAKPGRDNVMTQSAPIHKTVETGRLEAENAFFPKATHIPSTLNMTVTTESKTSVHVQLTRLEDNLATLSLQGTDEATTAALKKTRQELINHLDAAGIQPAGIKIAVLPTDTGNMAGEKGHGSFNNGAAFSAFSEQKQSQHNPTQQEWHSEVVNSVETSELSAQNEGILVTKQRNASSTHSLSSDLIRRGINISV